MEMDKTIQALLYLLRCGLSGTAPEPVPDLDHDALFRLSGTAPEPVPDLDHDALFRLSAFHSVTAMVAMVLDSGGLLAEPYADAEQAKRWKEARAKAIRKTILMDEERAQILQYMDAQGIWYLPLKGSILQGLYPKMGMRQMADNDILFDGAYRHQIKAYMESRGYKTVEFEISNHDNYEKLPVYSYELHVSLVNEYVYPKLAAYYADVKKRLKKDPDNACGYHFSHEDFYIYILVHGYKHYIRSGTGIRSLMDICVFLRSYRDQLDWDYIRKELCTLGIQDFEADVQSVADKLFAGEGVAALTQKEREFLGYLISSGVYGTRENFVKKSLNQLGGTGKVTVWTKLCYMWRRLFPNLLLMQDRFPLLRKHPWMLPAFWIYRIIRSVIFSSKNIRTEYGTMKKLK